MPTPDKSTAGSRLKDTAIKGMGKLRMLWPVACRGRKVIKGEAEGLDRVRQGR